MNDSGDWARGYPVHESYPASWHSFQSPAHLRAICALMGVAWEVGPDTPLAIAEVGCGTGYTGQVLAAGNPGCQVVGLDYNPAHIAEARSMVAAAGLANASFVEADLAELQDHEIDRLPEFDLITVHGVWSWVGDPVREGVLRLLRRRLKPGGVALVSYNALPGAATGLGLARLVRQALLAAGNSVDGVARAESLVKRLMEAGAAHLLPSGWRRLLTGEIKGARPGYLLHEFHTEHWRPSFHADVAAAMATARCDYVGSATIDENFPHMSLSAEQRALWEEAPDSSSRELMFDLCVQRAFRRDVYVRGLRRMPRDPVVDGLWMVCTSHESGEVALKTQAGEAQLPPALIEAVRGALAVAPRTIGELRALPGVGKATPSELLAMLVGSGCAQPMWRHPGSGAGWSQAVQTAQRFNAVAAERLAPHGVGSGQMALATPVLGGGLAVPAIEMGVAHVVARHFADPAARLEPAAIAQHLIPAGAQPTAEVRAGLEQEIGRLVRTRAAVWRALQAV